MESHVARLCFGLLCALLLCVAYPAGSPATVRTLEGSATLRAATSSALAAPAASAHDDGTDDVERSSASSFEHVALPAVHGSSRLDHARLLPARAPGGSVRVPGVDPLVACEERLNAQVRVLAWRLRAFGLVRDPDQVADRPTLKALPLRGPPRPS